jgi:ParB-like chromosome segregation protein Spo0J
MIRNFRRSGREPDLSSIVRELKDEEVLAIQLIENLQREELHGLAEAEAFEITRPPAT